MSSLDKTTLMFFRDELEKQALLKPLGKGILSMVSSAGKGALQATKSMGGGLLAVNKKITEGYLKGGMKPTTAKIVGGLTTAGVIGTGVAGVGQAAAKVGKNRQALQNFRPPPQLGVQQL